MRRTILHPRSLQPLRPLGYRKNGRAIWPILGGSEPPNQPPADPPKDPPADPPNQPPADPPADKGFPEGTPLEQMTVEQQRNYWKHYARQHETRANARSDYDAVKAKADELDRIKAEQQTPSERAIQEAREAGKAEAAAAAAQDQVQNLLRVALGARGKTGDDLDELVAAANPAAFITDGKVVADKVTTYAAKIAGTGTPGGGGGGGGNGLGQGRREGQGKPSVATGRELFENRRGRKEKTTTST